MSAALMVSTLLVLGWNVTLVAVAYLTETGPFRATQHNVRRMSRTLKSVSVDVGKPEFDARVMAWKRDGRGGTAEHICSRVTETSQKVERTVPYAEASVVVQGEEGAELRRCSVCMN